ncbi:hypothetical protein NLJ89_g3097 [Agrocybe chaxingu]|uniref:Uncharacterized protein n=1 Tax=Agrocybe chaxingu TaxID=84603 RepID=A0A9W8K341_9AGAR|nr:hypothetical protein NLJ89_g3097 [Agrocybe chaxingu]
MSQRYLLSGMELRRDDERWYDLLLHDLSDACLADRVSLGPFESTGPLVEGGLVGVGDGKAALYKKNGGDRSVEVYAITDDGKLELARTLREPAQVPNEQRIFMHTSGLPSSALLQCTSDTVVTADTYCRYPSSVRLTRWSSDPRLLEHQTVDFIRGLSSDTQRESHLRGHAYILPAKAFMTASYEHTLEAYDSDPITIIRSFTSDTLALQWTTAIPQENSKLLFIPRRNAALALGLTWSVEEGYSSARTKVALATLDAASGSILATHILPDPQSPCGNLSEAIGDADLTPSGNHLVLIFGDGQVAVLDVDEYLENGFSSVTNPEGRIITHPFPEVPSSTPKNKKERKAREEGYWSWVDKAYYGDGQVVLRPGVGEKKPTGFAVVSWE